MSKAKKKPKKAKEPFWKRGEFRSLSEHIGKTADNMKFNDWADFLIIAGLAYVGADKMKDWRGALVGPIGYKLATTMGGTPPVSQIAGLAILGGLGLISIVGETYKYYDYPTGQWKEVSLKEELPGPW